MKQTILLIVIAFISIGLTGCDDPPPINGNPSGDNTTTAPVDPTRDRSEVSTKVLEVDSFDALDVKGGFEVQINYGETQKVELAANKNSIDSVNATVFENSLKVETPNKFNAGHCQLTVTVPKLKAINANGSVLIKGTGLTGDVLNVAAKKSCSVQLSGNIDTVNATAGDSCSLLLNNLQVRICNVNVSGKSFAKINATEKLTANAQDGAVIHYWGNPKITSNIAKTAFLKKQK